MRIWVHQIIYDAMPSVWFVLIWFSMFIGGFAHSSFAALIGLLSMYMFIRTHGMRKWGDWR